VTRQRYHCFGCGADGDVIEFIRQTHGGDFREAVQTLAGMVGVALPENEAERQERSKRASLESQLHPAIEAAHTIYKENLQRIFDLDGRGPVAQYCLSRGIDKEVAARHGIGWARRSCLNPLLDRFGVDVLMQAGLLRESASGSVVDVFRDRLMFPIHNDKSAVIAFGGRSLSADAPKYINTPQTLLYDKSQFVFRYAVARNSIIQAGRAFVVEGYMDAISLAENGFDESIACCGTALTQAQLEKIYKVAQEVVFCFRCRCRWQQSCAEGGEAGCCQLPHRQAGALLVSARWERSGRVREKKWR